MVDVWRLRRRARWASLSNEIVSAGQEFILAEGTVDVAVSELAQGEATKVMQWEYRRIEIRVLQTKRGSISMGIGFKWRRARLQNNDMV